MTHLLGKARYKHIHSTFLSLLPPSSLLARLQPSYLVLITPAKYSMITKLLANMDLNPILKIDFLVQGPRNGHTEWMEEAKISLW
jgi:hypothetical protein